MIWTKVGFSTIMLGLLLFLAALYWSYTLWQTRRSLYTLFPAPEARRRHFHHYAPSLLIPALVIFLVAALILAGGMLGPSLPDTSKTKFEGSDQDILFVVDVSRSMDVTDVTPSRLERSKQIIRQLVQTTSRARFGLLAFAGEPFYYCPFVAEPAVFMEFLESMDSNIIGHQGTDFAAAIEAVDDILKDENRKRSLVLFSDGENQTDDAIQARHLDKVASYVFGIGTEAGGKVPYTDPRTGRRNQYLSMDNKVVESRFQPGALKELAAALGASYQTVTGGNNLALARAIHGSTRQFQEQNQEGHRPLSGWIGLAAFVLLVLARQLGRGLPSFVREAGSSRNRIGRKGNRSAALLSLLACISFHAPQLQAQPWSDTEYQLQQEALRLQKEKKYKEADQTLESLQQSLGKGTGPRQKKRRSITAYNRGNTLYQQNNYSQAADQYLRALKNSSTAEERSRIFNNLGNAWQKAGRRKQAAQAYQRSIQEQDNAQARRNLQQMFRKQPQQDQNQQQDQKKGNQDQQNQQQQSSQNQQGQQDPQKVQSGEEKQQQENSPSSQTNSNSAPKGKPSSLKKEMARRMIEENAKNRVRRFQQQGGDYSGSPW
jgi:Ca-activated chloride channel family protein